MKELRDIFKKPGCGGDFEGVSTKREDWLCTGWLWLRSSALRMREFAVRVSSSSESSTAGRRETEGPVGGITEEPTVDSDEPPWRAIREGRGAKKDLGLEPDEDMEACTEYE